MADAQRNALPSPDTRIGQWTCIDCRRRKIKCDKRTPCNNCIRSNTECITPNSGRSSATSPRRPGQKRRYVERTAAIEDMIQSFHEPGGSNASVSRAATGETSGSDAGPLTRSAIITDHSLQPDIKSNLEVLISESGGGRYVKTCLLDVLQHEVGGPRINLDMESGQAQRPTGGGLGFHLHMCEPAELRIRHELVAPLWGCFKSKVDPVIKMLHIPSMEPVMMAASNHQPVSTETEALIFAISYITIRSMTADECMYGFGQPRDVLSAYYRLGCEQASARARFIEATNVTTMQAHVLYLAALRSEADANAVWAMMGLAARAAQSFGLHRDGVHWASLSPFSIEMRRRLWWQLLELDARISEDVGRPPMVAETRFDTLMPLNVDDADLVEKMDEPPEPRKGLTEMTISLIGFELTNTLRRVLLSLGDTSGQPCRDLVTQPTGEERRSWVMQCHEKMEQTYLVNLDVGQPFAWVASTYARLVMSKMWLVVYAPVPISQEITDLSSDIVGKLFMASLEAIEQGNQLDVDSRADQWRWYLGKDLQWHSIIFLLSELSRHSGGDAVDRAWDAIEGLVRCRFQGEGSGPQQKVLLWQLVRRLLAKARMTREKRFMEELHLWGNELHGDHARPLNSHPAIDQLLAKERRS